MSTPYFAKKEAKEVGYIYCQNSINSFFLNYQSGFLKK
jgi:hypothetical protein